MSALPIETIDVRGYRLPLDPPFRAAWDPQPRTEFNVTLVRVVAGGLEGAGGGDAMAGFAGHERLFLGEDAFDIERHVRVLENLQFHYGRMWPLEVALWDLIARARGEPLWRALGGSEPRLRVYASTGERISASRRALAARRLAGEGFSAIKLRFWHDDVHDDIETVRAVCDAVGPDVTLLVDANQAWRTPADTRPPWSLETALSVAAALRELDVYWLEEPLHRHDYRGLAELRRHSGLRIAGGEGCREAAELREYLHHGSLDVYQHDVAWSSGILRATQLAPEIAAAGAMFTPHTWGDGLVLLANLHVAAACANAPFVEFPYDPPAWTPERRDFLLPNPIVAQDGFVTLPDAPGLGVQIDWAAIERYRIG